MGGKIQDNLKRIDRREFLKSAAFASLARSSFPNGVNICLASEATVKGVASIADSPYGVCAHLARNDEFKHTPKNLEKMKEAGIDWVRADFSWSGVENAERQWNFNRIDAMLERARRAEIQLLAALCYDVPWATPAYKNLDQWLEYVAKTVEHCRGQVRCWEIWNEQNVDRFWRDNADPDNYAAFLKETCKTIRKIDTNLLVLYGGLAGAPINYFKRTLEVGAGQYFDAINFHPYRAGLATRGRVERFQSDIRLFNEALREKGLPSRPIWITEMGWSTPPKFDDVNRRVVRSALRRLYPDRLPKVAFFADERYPYAGEHPKEDFCNFLGDDFFDRPDLIALLDAEQLKKISAEDVDALVMPPSETFPSDCFDAAVKFVKNGGTLILLGDAPLSYECRINPATGKYERGKKGNPAADALRAKLRVSWYASWNREGTPEKAPAVVARDVEGFKSTKGVDALEGLSSGYLATRFLDDKALAEGDKMLPLIEGRLDSFRGVAACVYDFDSDYQGAVVVSAIMERGDLDANIATVAEQAIFLPQAILVALATGVERFFWYEFQAPELDDGDRQSHFGIVGKALEPKPAYYAYSALTRARPAGSNRDAMALNDDVAIASWIRPDGKKGWAIWSPLKTKEKTLRIQGAVTEAFDYLGNVVKKPKDGAGLSVAPGILYLIGPKDVGTV